MQKKAVILTLAWFAGVTALPHATYAEPVLCTTPMECYEKAMGELLKTRKLLETQRAENERLQRQVANLEQKNQRLDQKVAQMERQIEPSPKKPSNLRYIDNRDGTVTDNRTGLVWLKNANCFGKQNWRQAMQSAANLADGQCGLRDGSSRGTWRLPTIEEWKAMVDTRYKRPVLSNAAGTGKWTEGDAFSGVQTGAYWSSTTFAVDPSDAWNVYFDDGFVVTNGKASTMVVWPVRGGH